MKKILYFLFIIVLFNGNATFAQTIYSNTSSSVFYSPAYISTVTGLPIIYLDDVNIPSSLMGNVDSLDVTRITFGFGKYGRQIPLWVDFYYSPVDQNATNINGVCQFPPVHFDSLYAYGRNMFGNLFKTYGDSVHTLFRVRTTRNVLKTGYNSFFVGMSFSISSDSAMGYVHGPLYTNKGTSQKANVAATWYYDGVHGTSVKKINGKPGAFYLVVWGRPTGSSMLPVPLLVNAGSQQLSTDKLTWTVYPNPVNNNTQIQLMLPAPERIRIEIFSQTGLLEQSCNNQQLPAGTHNIKLDLSRLPAGIHVLKLHVGDKFYNRTIYK